MSIPVTRELIQSGVLRQTQYKINFTEGVMLALFLMTIMLVFLPAYLVDTALDCWSLLHKLEEEKTKIVKRLGCLLCTCGASEFESCPATNLCLPLSMPCNVQQFFPLCGCGAWSFANQSIVRGITVAVGIEGFSFVKRLCMDKN